jgi:hypothetical protein
VADPVILSDQTADRRPAARLAQEREGVVAKVDDAPYVP